MTKKLIVTRNLSQRLADGNPIKSLVNRGVGKTTASILACIATAIRNPGTPCLPNDPDLSIKHAQPYWVRDANNIIARLGLQDIEANLSSTACPSVHIISTYAEEL